jgi:hypothetical protein
LIKYVEMRDDKEKACYRLPLVACQDRNEFVHRAKYELEHMMLVLCNRQKFILLAGKENFLW